MRFRTLLIHRCSLLTTGTSEGTDEYGRDIISRIEHANVPCRLDQVQQGVVSDETGTDLVFQHLMFFDALHDITEETEIFNITDKKGNPVLPGSFFVKSIMPIFDRSKLHHYEVTVQRK